MNHNWILCVFWGGSNGWTSFDDSAVYCLIISPSKKNAPEFFDGDMVWGFSPLLVFSPLLGAFSITCGAKLIRFCHSRGRARFVYAICASLVDVGSEWQNGTTPTDKFCTPTLTTKTWKCRPKKCSPVTQYGNYKEKFRCGLFRPQKTRTHPPSTRNAIMTCPYVTPSLSCPSPRIWNLGPN